MESTPLHKAVFFDRDGTINSDEGHYYIYKPEDFVFNPGVVEGMKRLQDAGYLLFVITNQGGVAKGIYTCEDVDRVHVYMCSELAKQGIQLTKIYYCPHHESVQACECKPRRGRISHRQAAILVHRRQPAGCGMRRSRRGHPHPHPQKPGHHPRHRANTFFINSLFCTKDSVRHFHSTVMLDHRINRVHPNTKCHTL